MADTQAMTVGGTGSLTGLATAESAVPRAQLINGLIGFRQTAEPLIDELAKVVDIVARDRKRFKRLM